MKENILVGEKWVYIKCTKCGKKKDFAKDAFIKRLPEEMTPNEYSTIFVCKTCASDKQNPVKIESEIKPYSKEKQLGKKEKKTILNETDEDYFNKK